MEVGLGAHAELTQAGIAAEAPLALSRPVEGLGEARFTLIQLPPGQTPGFHSFLCQHHTRDLVWRPEYQQHAIGTVGIDSVLVGAQDATAYAPLLEGLPVGFLPPDKSKGGRSAPLVTALRLKVKDRKRTAEALRSGGFAPSMLADGSVAVGADQAHGVSLIFA